MPCPKLTDCLYSKENTAALSMECQGANGAERKTENLRVAGKERRPAVAERGGTPVPTHGAWDTQKPCLPSSTLPHPDLWSVSNPPLLHVQAEHSNAHIPQGSGC